jgi:hypothetical protein
LQRGRHPLGSSPSDLVLLIQKSKSLDVEFTKIKMNPPKTVFVNRESGFRNVDLNLIQKGPKLLGSGIKKLKGRNVVKRREGAKNFKKKTKGPSLKRLSILEFKHNKQLTNFFKSKQKEIQELLKQKTFTGDAAFSLTSQSTNYTQDINNLSKNETNIKHFRDLADSKKTHPELSNVIPSEKSLSRPISNIFSISRQEPSSSKRRNFSSRDSKGLYQMSRSLIRLLSNNPSENFSLDNICAQIQVEKRKIYDLINILTSIRMINRVSKGVYKWLGTDSILEFLNSLPNFKNLSDSLKTEKSLGSMCYCFLAFMKSTGESSIETAAESLTRSVNKEKPLNSITFRSKIRRLYDISKILATVGLIENLSENKKPIMRWVGADNMLKVVRNISSSEEVPIGTLDMRQMMERLQNSLNNAVLTIPEAEMRRKRIESVDMGIVEKYFSSEDQGLILPRVSVVIPDI